MKKLKMMSLLLVVLLCLTACGGTTTTEEPSDTSGDTSSEENSDVVEFPTQDIRVIVPYAAGGNTDLDGRAIANIIDQNSLLSKTMVVTNITGANTMNAAQSLLDAEPDGHTLLMHHTAFIASSAAGTVEIQYSNFKPLIEASIQPFVLSVAASSGFATADDIIQYAKENPGELTVGYVGTGSTSHLAATIFLQASGIYDNVKMITYSSSTDALTAQLGGELVVRVGPAADSARYVTSGELVAVAVSNETDIDVWAGVPTFANLGSDISYACRQGYYVRKEVPQEVCDILIQAISQAISTDEYAEFCASNGMEPSGLYGDELQSAWDADYEMIKEIFDSGAMG